MNETVYAEFRNVQAAEAVASKLAETLGETVTVQQKGTTLVVECHDAALVQEEIFWLAASGMGGLARIVPEREAKLLATLNG